MEIINSWSDEGFKVAFFGILLAMVVLALVIVMVITIYQSGNFGNSTSIYQNFSTVPAP